MSDKLFSVYCHEGSEFYWVDYNDEHFNPMEIVTIADNLNYQDAIQLRNKKLGSKVGSSSCLIVDGDYLFHRIAHLDGFARLHNKKNFPTGLIYGVLKNLVSILRSFPYCTRMIYVVGGKSQFRKSILSTYKEREVSTEEEPIMEEFGMTYREVTYLQLPLLTEIIKNLGIYFVSGREMGVEADDIITYYALKEQDFFESTIIVSDDNDFLQLVSDRCYVYRPIKTELITPDNFVEKFQIRPKFYQYYKAIVGEGSECPQLIFRLGDATTIKFINTLDQGLQEHKSILLDIYEKAKLSTSSLVKRISEPDTFGVFKRNLRLVDLFEFYNINRDIKYNLIHKNYDEDFILKAVTELELDSISSALLTEFRILR